MNTPWKGRERRGQGKSRSEARSPSPVEKAKMPVAPANSRAKPLESEKGRGRDLPETAESIRRSLDRLRELEAIVNRSPVVILKRGLTGDSPVEFITENVRQFGYRADEFLSGAVSLASIIHHEDVTRVEEETAVRLGQGAASFVLEYRFVTRSGDERWVEERNFCVRDDKGRAIAIQGILLDITEAKKLREEVLAVGAREQARMSQDLHDTVGQSLTGAAILTKSLEHALAARGAPEAADAAHLAKLLNEATAKTRQLSRGILPFEPTSSGLAEAIENYASGTRYLFGVNCRFTTDGKALAIDDASAIHLYRIVQEAVNNAVKHAKASEVLIAIAATEERTTLSIRDNGVGLVPGWDERGGLGIRIMRYRAESIGAEFDLRNAPGGGTVAVCTLNKA